MGLLVRKVLRVPLANRDLLVQPEQMAQRGQRAIPAQPVLRVLPVQRVPLAQRDRLVQQALKV